MTLKHWLAIHLGTRLLRIHSVRINPQIPPSMEIEVSGEVMTDLAYSGALGLDLPAPRPPNATLKFYLERSSSKYKEFLNLSKAHYD